MSRVDTLARIRARVNLSILNIKQHGIIMEDVLTIHIFCLIVHSFNCSIITSVCHVTMAFIFRFGEEPETRINNKESFNWTVQLNKI